MSTVVTMHQPNYLPWIGLFSKLSLADCFLVYDVAQYEKDGVINRNKIRVDNGADYLTVPVGKWHTGSKITDILLPSGSEWKNQHWRRIHDNYARTPYFKQYAGFFETVYRGEHRCLCELNEQILHYLMSCFGIDIRVVKTSELGIMPDLQKTDRMIAYLKEVGAETYLSGPSGKNYLDTGKFAENGMTLKFLSFTHPVYPQRYPGFEPNLSAIDLLFNMGSRAGDIIRESARIEDS